MISGFKSKSLWSTSLAAAVMIGTASVCLTADQVKPEKNKPEAVKKEDNARTSAEKKGVPADIQKKLKEIIIDHMEFENVLVS